MSDSWPDLAPTTLAEQVYRALRTRLLDGHVAPGAFLRETDLEAALGVSRTPIREALARLASEGFLEKIPHRGFRLPDEPLGDLLELYPVVAALDLLAGRLALPRFTAADIEELHAVNDALDEAREQSDVQVLIDLNNRFHDVFGQRSGNRRLQTLLHDLRLQLTRLERWYYSDAAHAERSIRQHAEIITAVEAGDHDRALDLLERNMALTYDGLLEETAQREGV